MKVTRLFFAIMTVCTIGILVIGCGNKNELPQEETVNRNLNVAIYAAMETEGKITPLEPALLQECISLDKIIHYDRDGDYITVPFQFKDSVGYAKITEANIGKRIVITVDGEVVATPMVQMRIGNGACSVLLSKEQAQNMFPKEKIEKLLP
jgi:preprotein translocase subunit SecD